MSWSRRRLRELRALSNAADAYGISKLQALSDFIKLATRDRYSPVEVLGLGLLDPMSPIKPDRYVSSESLLPIQRRLNPAAQHYLTEDKIEFHRKCHSIGLPTPQILGIFSRRPDNRNELPVIKSGVDMISAVGERTGVVFKPLNGTHGNGVSVLSVVNGRFWAPNGNNVEAEDILTQARKSDYATWLLQERLRPHPEFVRLSGQPVIQTIRLVTYIEPAGSVTVPFAWVRVVGGPTGADNFSFGRTGNFASSIDFATGTLEHTLGKANHGYGLARMYQHPVTGVQFDGFPVPEFAAACKLVKRAAVAFVPLRTIGWDVAVTDNGISLIEGNVTWDPLPTCNDVAAIVRRIS